jgi:hypothetical protein
LGTLVAGVSTRLVVGGQSARVGLVTFQALGSVMIGGFGARQVTMRVVAGGAGQCGRLGVAPALVELFDVTDDGHAAVGVVEHIVGAVFGESLTGSEVGEASVSEIGGGVVLQVALCADRFESFSGQRPGVHDRIVCGPFDRLG